MVGLVALVGRDARLVLESAAGTALVSLLKVPPPLSPGGSGTLHEN
jgi:hypothetical protein